MRLVVSHMPSVIHQPMYSSQNLAAMLRLAQSGPGEVSSSRARSFRTSL
jgi:hypothetical protein